MSRRQRESTALPLALALCALLAGCGSSSTTTVTAKDEPPAPSSSTTSTGTTAPSTTTSAQQQPPAEGGGTVSSSGGTPAPSQTHTAPEPAFTEGGSSGSANAAEAVLRARDYTPVELSQYHANQTLTVLVGARSASAPYGQQAFFFLDGRYLGTDAKEPSATVSVVSQDGTEVTLAYPLYRTGDALGSPSGGRAVVRFQLNNGQLQAVGTIPPASRAHRRSGTGDTRA